MTVEKKDLVLSHDDQRRMLASVFDLYRRMPNIIRSFADKAEDDNAPMNERIWAYSKIETFAAKFAESVAKHATKDMSDVKDMFALNVDEIAEKGRAKYGDVFIQWLKDYADGKAGGQPPALSDSTPSQAPTQPASQAD